MSTSEQSRFKNQMGVRYLQGLFYETVNADKSTVLYTLKDADHMGFPSLYRLYIEAEDPTEYKFATAHLDGWDHWDILSSCSWMQPYVTRWRRELDIRLRSRALAEIQAVAAAREHNSHFTANKYLLEATWKPAGERKVGRTTKDAIRAEATRLRSAEREIEDDAKRILTVN